MVYFPWHLFKFSENNRNGDDLLFKGGLKLYQAKNAGINQIEEPDKLMMF